jgi:hypothetical protein
MTIAKARFKQDAAFRRVMKFLKEGEAWCITFNVPYAGYVEFGTGPSHEPDPHGQFSPPLKPLLQWVMSKFSLDEKAAYPIALAVQKKIKYEGASPHPFARPAVATVRFNLAEILDEELSLKHVVDTIAKQAAHNIETQGISDTGLMRRNIYIVKGNLANITEEYG